VACVELDTRLERQNQHVRQLSAQAFLPHSGSPAGLQATVWRTGGQEQGKWNASMWSSKATQSEASHSIKEIQNWTVS